MYPLTRPSRASCFALTFPEALPACVWLEVTPESRASGNGRPASPSADFGRGTSASLTGDALCADAETGTRVAAVNAAPSKSFFTGFPWLVAVDREVHVVLRGADPRASPAPADRREGPAHGRRDHPRPHVRPLEIRERGLVARHPAADVRVLARVEVDRLPERVHRPVVRGRAAAAWGS